MHVIAIVRMVIHCRSSRSRKSKKENNRVKCRNGAFLWCRRFFWDIAGNLFRTSAAQPFWEALARHATERHATLKQPWHNRRALKRRGGGLCLARTLQALFFQLAFTTILRLFYFRPPLARAPTRNPREYFANSKVEQAWKARASTGLFLFHGGPFSPRFETPRCPIVAAPIVFTTVSHRYKRVH